MSSHNDSFVASGSSPTQRAEQGSPDFLLENHSSIYLPRNYIGPHVPTWLVLEEIFGADVIWAKPEPASSEEPKLVN